MVFKLAGATAMIIVHKAILLKRKRLALTLTPPMSSQNIYYFSNILQTPMHRVWTDFSLFNQKYSNKNNNEGVQNGHSQPE